MRRVKKTGKPNDVKKDPPAAASKPLNLTPILVVVVLLILIVAVAFAYSSGLAGTGSTGGSTPATYDEKQQQAADREASVSKLETELKDLIEQRTSECVEHNPSLNREICMDISLRDTAIEKNDQSICDLVISESGKDMCKGYFSST